MRMASDAAPPTASSCPLSSKRSDREHGQEEQRGKPKSGGCAGADGDREHGGDAYEGCGLDGPGLASLSARPQAADFALATPRKPRPPWRDGSAQDAKCKGVLFASPLQAGFQGPFALKSAQLSSRPASAARGEGSAAGDRCPPRGILPSSIAVGVTVLAEALKVCSS